MLIFRFLSGAVSMEMVIKVNDLKSVSVVTTVNRKAHISIQMAPVLVTPCWINSIFGTVRDNI